MGRRARGLAALPERAVHSLLRSGRRLERRVDNSATRTGLDLGQHVYYISTVYSLVEIYEFAARLALSPAGDVFMHVEVEMANLKGRRLMLESIHYPLGLEYRITESAWKHFWEGAQTELIAKPRELSRWPPGTSSPGSASIWASTFSRNSRAGSGGERRRPPGGRVAREGSLFAINSMKRLQLNYGDSADTICPFWGRNR